MICRIYQLQTTKTELSRLARGNKQDKNAKQQVAPGLKENTKCDLSSIINDISSVIHVLATKHTGDEESYTPIEYFNSAITVAGKISR